MLSLPLVAAAIAGSVVVKTGYLVNQRKRKSLLIEQLTEGTCPRRLTHVTIADALPREQASVDRRSQPSVSTNVSQAKAGSTDEQTVNHYLAVSTFSVAMATGGALFFPPLTLLSIPGIVYCVLPIWQETRHALVEERRFKMVALDSIVIPLAVISKSFFAASLDSFVFYISRKLIKRTEDHSRASLVNVFGAQPNTAWVQIAGQEVEIPIEQLSAGDMVVVAAGQMIPVDGLIVDGTGTVDERVLTGEARPVEKGTGESVLAATMLLQGSLSIQVEREGTETVAAQIESLLEQTVQYTSTIELKGKAFTDAIALPLFLLGGVALLTVGLHGALAVLAAPIANAIRVSSPLSILTFLRIASAEGILVKDGRALETLKQVDTVVFDKTGTLTKEQPHIGQIHLCPCGAAEPLTRDELLAIAAAAEIKQTHPIARAICTAAHERGISIPTVEATKVTVGYGLDVMLHQQQIQVGSKRYMVSSAVSIPSAIEALEQVCDGQGHSLVYIAIDGQLAGAIELHTTIRPEAKAVVDALHQLNIATYIISGDQETPTRLLAEELGIETYFAQTLPENKAQLIEELQAAGRTVCFVGDGINDSIALKQAHVSISMRGASTVATDTAQIILMDQSLRQLPSLMALVGDLDSNMKRNLLLAVVPGIICIGGAFLLNFSFLSAILLYQVSIITSVTNAMLPLLKYHHKKLLQDLRI